VCGRGRAGYNKDDDHTPPEDPPFMEASMETASFMHASNTTLPRCPGTERWGRWPSPVGLTLGILFALVAQIAVIAYHYARLRWCATRRVQTAPRPYEFFEGIQSHLANPGGILMMVVYLCATWMFDVMPCSYYRFSGGVRWWMVFAQIACQDLLMFLLHYFEHKGPLGPAFYKRSHKPHHRYVNPRLFDAFDGQRGRHPCRRCTWAA
jgi:sterol desaturase/sphingolipid hydroxylase (fatty acid hydroxylase superfamily)